MHILHAYQKNIDTIKYIAISIVHGNLLPESKRESLNSEDEAITFSPPTDLILLSAAGLYTLRNSAERLNVVPSENSTSTYKRHKLHKTILPGVSLNSISRSTKII